MCDEPSLLKSFRARHPTKGSFTLVEMLVAVAVLAIILAIVFTMTQQAADIFKKTSGQMEAFRSARNAFETMTRQISLATLNNYYDYLDASGAPLTSANSTNFAPASYALTSNLHFVSGKSLLTTPPQVTQSLFFQAPLGYTTTGTYQGLGNLLNAVGYYIEYSTNAPPNFLSSSSANYRYRLMEFLQPTESMTVYTTSLAASTANNWFTVPLATPPAPVHLLADNIIALIILPRNSLGDSSSARLTTDYEYDTRALTGTPPTPLNQLPPIVEVVMVAIDEASASRLAHSAVAGTQPSEITTALAGLFQKPSTTASISDDQLTADIKTLGDRLSGSHIRFLVFQTNVPLRGSKLNN